MKRFLPLAVVILLEAAAQHSSLAAEGEAANPLFDEQVRKGITLPEGPTVKLPAPIIPPGPPPANLTDLLDQAAGSRPVDLFLRRSLNAPFSLTIRSVERKKDDRCAQEIDLKFVAYGKLEAVLDSDFLTQFLSGKQKKGGSGEQNTVLEPADLKERGIRLLNGRSRKEQYSTITMSLLNKVQVDGVMRTVRTDSPDFVLSATRMDDRFQNDKQYPNTWRPINVLDEEEKLGPPRPYTGLAGYVLATKLPEPRGALLIEMHFLLHEPPAWFGERNLLRSKLPGVIQENVRSFRRKLNK
jgi:hypothetical protein